MTGIRVVYDTYDTTEILETKLLTGDSGYDVVFPSSTYMGRLANAGALMKLDKSRLANLGNLDPELMEQVALSDPGNEHAIAYTWGTTGIAYNATLVQQGAGYGDGRQLECHLRSADRGEAGWMRDHLPRLARRRLRGRRGLPGHRPRQRGPAGAGGGRKVLRRVRPYVRNFDSSEYPGTLATGETCIAIGWSGVKQIARNSAGHDQQVLRKSNTSSRAKALRPTSTRQRFPPTRHTRTTPMRS